MNNLQDLLEKLKALEEANSATEMGNPVDPEAGAGASDESVEEGGWDIDDPDAAAKQQALNQRVQNTEVDEDGNWVPRKSMAQTSAEWQAAQAAKKPAPQKPAPQQQPAPDTQGGAGAADESMAAECGGGDGNVQLSMDDLVKLVRALQGGGEPSDGGNTLLGDEYANEPNAQVAPISAVTATGDDLASKGDEALKTNGGGNPMQAHLAELYSQIKEAAKKSDIPAAQRKAKGGDWKVSKQDLEAEEKDGKISHKDTLAKNNGTSLKEANQIRRQLLGK